ncbi:MAG TPA: ABC transporter permease, partial [Kribbella sp.]|nr:ABC transporter permease [Kribbella sp.]
MSNEQSRTTLQRPWQLVAQREVSTKIRDKTFIGSTAFMLILVLAAVIIPALISGSGGPDK